MELRLQELQTRARGPHPPRKPVVARGERGRRGLDVLDALADLPGVRLRADERTFPGFPDVDAKLVALGNHARQRGFALSADVGGYLLNHCSRDMVGLMCLIDRLDRGSLVAKRRITIPFIKSTLE